MIFPEVLSLCFDIVFVVASTLNYPGKCSMVALFAAMLVVISPAPNGKMRFPLRLVVLFVLNPGVTDDDALQGFGDLAPISPMETRTAAAVFLSSFFLAAFYVYLPIPKESYIAQDSS